MLLLENIDKEDLKEFLKEFYNYALGKLKVDRPPKLYFRSDQPNADDMFGKTGYYDPDGEKIVLFITDRHAKDVLRSFAHELIHHEQKCRGSDEGLELQKTATDPAYATNDPDLREMEREAFERGNMLFRDWCDMKKVERKKIMNESKKMKIKVLKEKEMEEAASGEGEMDEVSYEKSGLEHPEKADLDKNKDVSGWEKARGKAIEKSMKTEAGTGFGEGPEGKEKLQESKEAEPVHPYPQLFQKKDRLMKDRFNSHEEIIYQEMLKRAIKQTSDK